MNIDENITDNLNLNCPSCHQHYDSPKILPCCYDTICDNCLNILLKNSTNQNEYYCSLCTKTSKIPENGFHINKALLKFIKVKETPDDI